MDSQKFLQIGRLQALVESIQSELDEARSIICQLKGQDDAYVPHVMDDSAVDIINLDDLQGFHDDVEIDSHTEHSVSELQAEEASVEDTPVVEPSVEEPVEESFAEPVAEPFETPETEVEDNAIEEPSVAETTVQEPVFEEPVFEEPVAPEPSRPEPQIQQPVREATLFSYEPEPVVEETPVFSQPTVNEVFDEPKPVAAATQKLAFVDSMLTKAAWKIDIPGSHVNDVRSAIALNDRILFIKTLFGGDPEVFQKTISAVNQMTCLEDAIEYVDVYFPDWDMESDTVYRFMMAVRRKVEQ